MAEVVLKTNEPDKVSEILKDALETEKSRVQHSLNLTMSRLEKFEQKYNISSEKFISQWTAEDLENGDMEYVEWTGEYQFALTLNERLTALKSIEYVSP
ncbi:MAG: hypothetical protein JSV88_08530 [Candidatus Aminicenantes bacterium]|nr:MAG: hypothetical protein JSV88_08530 [Candidatus Aminicenantes bacterium]